MSHEDKRRVCLCIRLRDTPYSFHGGESEMAVYLKVGSEPMPERRGTE